MTCYETLRAPAPAVAAPMAHHFVKWWRNKFRNGYKKFSLGTDGERTDTEELVGRAASQCSAPPDLLPSEVRAMLQPPSPTLRPTRTQDEPPKPVTPHEDYKHPRLRFEELTCDVELKHPEPSKQKPLQFSFTLYDLDGHGRMTKDDIAGIVSTIYESIGKSVTVPHYGSKTIQVRLTVVPEGGRPLNHREKCEGRRRRRRKEAAPAAAASPPPPHCAHPDSEEEHAERLSHDDDESSKSSSSGERRPLKRPAPHQNNRPHRNPTREHDRKNKKRSGSLQRRELLEIIQANMEKNHLSFQASRKPYEPVANDDDVTAKYHKMRNRSYTVSEKPTHAFQKVKGETPEKHNGYLDLAGGGDSNLCRYDRYLHAVICSSARHAHTGYHQKQPAPPPGPPGPPGKARPHHAHPARSRSHDLPAHTTHTAQPRVLQIIFL